ncbi:glycosyltransferase family A protein [Pseudomonas luteola]|uniref:glycosyltransferase family 2 protein n=1 Tax=Pseudomonas luteola TaxID=47886 RepID=UPI003A8846AB
MSNQEGVSEENCPLVTVIIASYNHAPYIEASILSVLKQSYPHIELLVIDDGSTDDSVQRILSLQKEYGFDFRQQQNIGLSRTLNDAIERASGSLIVPFGSDDIMLPQRIERQVAYIKDKREVGICAANIDLIDAQGQLYPEKQQKHRYLPFRRLNFEDLFLDLKPGPMAATLMFRREALLKVGCFDPSIRLEDLYITLKITQAGYYIDILDEVLALYRKHESNTYKNLPFMVENVLKTYERFSDHPAYGQVKTRFLNSMFLKASNRNKPLARALLRDIPIQAWTRKTVRGLLRLMVPTH